MRYIRLIFSLFIFIFCTLHFGNSSQFIYVFWAPPCGAMVVQCGEHGDPLPPMSARVQREGSCCFTHGFLCVLPIQVVKILMQTVRTGKVRDTVKSTMLLT